MTTPASRTEALSTEPIPSPDAPPRQLSDISVMIGGQGGDGTLTVSDLLGR